MARFLYYYVLSLFAFVNCDLPPNGKTFKRRGRQCPRDLSLENGYVKFRAFNRFAYFHCHEPYTRIGASFAYCERGKWSRPPPVCISPDCVLPHIPRRVIVDEKAAKAHVLFTCPDGYLLRGSPSIICQDGHWNGTVPKCESTARLVNRQCDFETGLCGWEQSSGDDFDWILGTGKTATKLTGPSHDHTFGDSRGGHYLYLEAMEELYDHNPSARLYSPTLSERVSRTSCLQFWYHSYGATIGKLNVYVNSSLAGGSDTRPSEIQIFNSSGNKGDKWFLANITLPDLESSFKIIIEGEMGEGFLGDLAIDDVMIYQCRRFDLPLEEPEPTLRPTTEPSLTTTFHKSKTDSAITDKILTDQPVTRDHKDGKLKKRLREDDVGNVWKDVKDRVENSIYRDVAPRRGAITEESAQDIDMDNIKYALLIGCAVFTLLIGIGCFLRKYRATLTNETEV